MKAKLIACNVPASNVVQMQQFYSALLGVDLARSLNEQFDSYHAPLSNEGQFLWVSERQDPDEKITAVFAVDDLNTATQDAKNAGAQPFGAPIDTGPISPKVKDDWKKHATPGATVTDSLGQIAYFKDPDDNVIALMEVAPHAHRSFKVGKFKVDLSPDVQKGQDEARKVGQKLKP